MATCRGLGITMGDLEKTTNDKKTTEPEPTYTDVERLVARNGKQMSVGQKTRLIKLLSETNNES